MRALPEGAFDAVVHWGNSFGYMPHADTLAHLASTRRALRRGGRLVLETATVAESVLPGLRGEFEYEAGGVTMRVRQEYDAPRGRLVGQMTFEDRDGRVERAGVVHHVHTVAEVARMLESAGFRVDALLGDPRKRTPYALGAPRLVVLASI